MAPTCDERGRAALDDAWETALRRERAVAEPAVVLFSGGVDSGLIGWELRVVPGARLFTVGVPGADDLRRAGEAARAVGLPWSRSELSPEDVADVAGRLREDLVDVPGPRRGIFLALGLAFRNAPPGRLWVGQGADELFLGYAHFRRLGPEAAERRSAQDLAQLVDDDWPRTVAIAGRFGRTVVAPYLDAGVVAAARAIPISERLPAELTKPWFRRWAEHRELPELLVGAPKRAIQYGSGVDRLSRSIVRSAGRPPPAG